MAGDSRVNIPEVRIEVESVFARYEAALVGNDVETLDALFLASHEITGGAGRLDDTTVLLVERS